MRFELANILVFLSLAVGFLLVTLTLGKLLRPSTPDHNKNMIYECGEVPIGQAWFNFNPRFYIVALVFLIFDVEVAFTWPVARVFKSFVRSGEGALAFAELAVFVVILIVGLAYVWVKGDLEWLKQIVHDENREPVPGASRAEPATAPKEAA